MSRIRIRDQANNKWVTGREFTPPEVQERFQGAKQRELDSTLVRLHEAGDETTPQLFELAFEPHFQVDLHSHASDEIFYVVKGTLEFGKRSLAAGSSILVRANTLYGFRAGPDGVQLLNFRPHADAVYRTPEEHAAWACTRGDAHDSAELS